MQHSRAVSQQHGKTQKPTAAEVAARVQLLLADGFSEAQVAAVIDRTRGGPYFDVAQAVQTLGLLRKLGLTVEQRAGCVAEFPGFLMCSPDQVAAVLQLLRAELDATKQQMARIICREPRLLSFLPETLAAKLTWWQGLTRSESTQRAVLASLRQNPGVLTNGVEPVRCVLSAVVLFEKMC